jgi:xylulose-5-phosphate/fructose-6-phosphate phosphoketolase
VRNELDRFHLVGAALDQLPQLGGRVGYLKQDLRDRLRAHHDYIREHGDDVPAIRDWTWPAAAARGRARRPRSDTSADSV